MGDRTGISWCDASWNPIRGCSRVSDGCTRCYAEQQAARIVRMGKGKPTAYDGLVKLTKAGEPRWTGEVRLVPEMLSWPLRKRKPLRIFVNSMSDLFHESLTNEQIAAVFGVMAAAPQHTFQILTKRARRMREWFEWAARDFAMQQRCIASAPHTFRAMLDAAYEILGKPSKAVLDIAWHAHEDDVWPLPNCWLGVSVENQAAADERIPDLLRTPAAVRFLSCEPLLGPVDLNHVQRGGEVEIDSLNGTHGVLRPHRGRHDERISWLIAGCESGPGARECKVEWLRSLRDQCASAGVPFFLKQAVETSSSVLHGVACGTDSKMKPGRVVERPYLDGEQHLQFPQVNPLAAGTVRAEPVLFLEGA